MEPSNVVGIWSALMSTLQGIGAIYGFVDRNQKNRLEKSGTPVLSRFNPLAVSFVLAIGALLAISFAVWMFVAKPLRPKTQTVEKTVYVDRYLQCPPTKTGPANAHAGAGGIAIGHSGNGDQYNIPGDKQK